MGDGKIGFAPFADVTVTDAITEYLTNLKPFGQFETGFAIDIARDFEISITDNPVFGLDESGATVEKTGRRVGIMMFDGFGGVHIGGKATRFAPAYLPTGTTAPGKKVYTINGQKAVAFSVNPALRVQHRYEPGCGNRLAGSTLTKTQRPQRGNVERRSPFSF